VGDLEVYCWASEIRPQHEIIHYVNSKGEPNAYPLWQILFHQANHAGQHRGEIAMVLTGFGHSPGWLDYWYFLDLQKVA